jgi:predicted RNase H-like nuclease
MFIGIDLAWSPRNPSGAAVIRDQRLVAYTGNLRSNDDIFRYIRTHLPAEGPTVVGVDAPLRVPNETGSRRCDRELTAEWRRYHAGALPANRRLLGRFGPDSSAWCDEREGRSRIRGEALVDMLVQRLHFTETAPIPRQTEDRIVCEIYPNPAHVSLFGLETTLKYKARSGRGYAVRWAELERYQRLLRRLRKATPALKGTKKLLTETDVRRLRGQALKQYEDVLDAISCAYVASYLWYHGPRRARVYGSVAEGHIVVPMTEEMERRLHGQRKTGSLARM